MTLLASVFRLYQWKRQLRSDAEVARDLGLKRSALANYKTGERELPDVALMQIANVTGYTVVEVLAARNITFKRTSDEERSYWVSQITDSDLLHQARDVERAMGIEPTS